MASKEAEDLLAALELGSLRMRVAETFTRAPGCFYVSTNMDIILTLIIELFTSYITSAEVALEKVLSSPLSKYA